MNIIVYDFEVLKEDWCMVYGYATHVGKIDFENDFRMAAVCNDPNTLRFVYEKCKDNTIWVGYNSNHYDQLILKTILNGKDPYLMNKYLIEEGNGDVDEKSGKAMQKVISKIFTLDEFYKIKRSYPIYSYDIFMPNDGGLKSLESSMGVSIEESKVPFNIDRKLTYEELVDIVKYCRYDVYAAAKVFNERYSTFETDLGLVELINGNRGKEDYTLLSKTETQLAALMLGAKRIDGISADEFEFELPKNVNIIQYRPVYDWYADKKNRHYYHMVESARTGTKKREPNRLNYMISGVPHTFGFGGLHGSRDKFSYICKEDEIIICADVSSFYPSYLILYKSLSRSVKDPTIYEDIYKQRLAYKAAGNPAQEPLKLVLNKTTGGMKTEGSDLYDPKMNNQMCVSCQMYLLDLIERLENENLNGYLLLQSNTDAVYFKVNLSDKDRAMDICREWMKVTGFQLTFDECTKIFQKDVNNYLLVTSKGKIKTKGAYVKEQGELNRDMPVVRDALVKYMLYGTPVEETIKHEIALLNFIQTTKVTTNYLYAVHGDERLATKCNRVFASLREEDEGKGIFKAGYSKGKSTKENKDNTDKDKDITLSKFANTPDSVFIDNTDIRGVRCPDYLDKEWYIWFAIKRLKDFGIDYVRADGVLPPPPPPTKTDLVKEAKFNACKKYFEEHGNLKPKAKTVVDDINIASWVNTVKKNFKEGKLSDEDINKYLSIGIDFTESKSRKRKTKGDVEPEV